MKLMPGHLLTLGILFVFLGIALASPRSSSPKRRSITDEESTEKSNSLFGIDDDGDDEASSESPGTANKTSGSGSSTTSTTPKPKPSKDKKTKSKSRQIKLPDDYDKLQIPSQGNVKSSAFVKNLFGEDMLDVISDEEFSLFDTDDDDDNTFEIEVEADVRTIREVDEINEEITVELDFIVRWTDFIILYENKEGLDALKSAIEGDDDSIDKYAGPEAYMSLDPSFLKKIWKPDLFIENVVSITRPELITKPIRILFNPAGLIIFSTRVTVNMDCEMEFQYYPADTQHCVFKIRSYSYTKKEIDITWRRPGPFLLDPSEHNFDVKMDIMESVDLNGKERLFNSNYTETFQVLQFKISSRRKMSYHLIQTYLPSAFFIFITWLSFLVPATMVEARIGISMTTLLTLTAMFASVRESTPTVSYVKAIDTWMVACIFFVFLTLLQFTLLTWRRHLKTTVLLVDEDDGAVQRKVAVKNKNEHQNYVPVETSEGKVEHIELERLSQTSRQSSKADILLRGIPESDLERYGFLAFFVLFLIFNLIYWPWLLISSEYFNWEVDPKYNAVENN